MSNVLGTLAQQIQQFLDAYERSAVLLERIVCGSAPAYSGEALPTAAVSGTWQQVQHYGLTLSVNDHTTVEAGLS